MSTESGTTKAAQPSVVPPAIKILPPQVVKLIKEEDEETWISGEELCTEGSSDEETHGKSKLLPRPLGSASPPGSSSNLLVSKSKRADVNRPKARSPLASDQAQSSSRSCGSVEGSDVEDEPVDREISWKANRDEALLKSEIKELQEYQREREKLSRSMNELFNDLVKKLKHFESIQNDSFARNDDGTLEEMKMSMRSFDSKISKLQSRLENVKKQTRQVQWQNRLRLEEILNQSPLESKNWARNTKNFMDLFCRDKIKKK